MNIGTRAKHDHEQSRTRMKTTCC